MTTTVAPHGLPAPQALPAPTPPPPPIAGDEQAPAPGRNRKIALLLVLVATLAALVILAIWYLLFRQPINPLPPIAEFQMPSYTSSVYGMARPLGMAVSPAGDRIYVLQSGTANVGVVYDASGSKVGTMSPPAKTGNDHQPVYAAVDPTNGEVYVTDRPTGAIYIYDRDGVYRRQFALMTNRPGWQPVGVAFDRAGMLYVTDFAGSQVEKIDRSGEIVQVFGDKDGLNFPNGVAVDSNGDVFVTDSNNGRLIGYAPDGRLFTQVGRGAGRGNLGLPRGISIDGAGRIYVCDTTAQAVFIFKVPNELPAATGTSTVTGSYFGRGGHGFAVRGPAVAPKNGRVPVKQVHLDFVGSFGVPGAGDGQFGFPTSVVTDTRGRVYVGDTFNDRVQLWSY